ncbi:MAG: ScpA family protein [Oscillospiraceae bacterium]
MENLTFHLEGVVKTREDMEDFEGPLTLILQLLSKNKIEIKDIQISLILDQYLDYLEEMKSMDLEVASEFVAMASHLVYIKTRMLLSEEEEVSELDQLISSLESLRRRDTYARIKAVTDTLHDMYRLGAGTYIKPPEYFAPDMEYNYAHPKEDIYTAIRCVFDRGDTVRAAVNPRPFAVPERIVYSVSKKAEEIIQRLKIKGPLRLNTFYFLSENRTELVATFMALLELCKAGCIFLSQADEDDFVINYTGTNIDLARLDGMAEEE